MKKQISFVLVLTLVASLFSGCAGEKAVSEAPAETVTETAAEATTEATTEPTTEPTLSAEEVLLASLSERTRQAYELGIVPLELLWDLERPVTIGEASAMLQKAYVHRTGVESKMLAELMAREDWAGKNADRGWIAYVPGLADLEMTYGGEYKNYEQWFADTNSWEMGQYLSFYWERLGMNINWIDGSDNMFRSSGFGGEHELCADNDLETNGLALIYGCMVYDSLTGEKYFTLDEGPLLNFSREVSVGEAVQYALVYYNFPNPMAYPNFAAPEEVGKYNEEIITADLLEKETDLPAASCGELPANWHGVVMDDLIILEENSHEENRIFEYEIQAVKDAGFNYIGLELDFNWLEDSYIYLPHKYAYNGLAKAEDEGKIDLDRLEHIDQVLAWCMEYDIHLNLRCIGVGGFGDFSKYGDQCRAVANAGNYKEKLAAKWGAIARRYTDIPNEYLSFTLFTGREDMYNSLKVKNELVIPSVEAIRRESPERCIIADVFNGYQDPEELAQLGVALSYRINEPVAVFDFSASEYFSYKNFSQTWNTMGEYAVKNFTWPYQNRWDAEALLNVSHGKGDTAVQVMETAEEYGVGFMLSEFGVHITPWSGIVLSRSRYPDEHYRAMIVDITDTMKEKGYGWCFAHWYNPYGVAFADPIIENTEYAQVGDHPYYIDQRMLSWVQEINGVS